MAFQGNDRNSLAPVKKDNYIVPEFLVEYKRRTCIERMGEVKKMVKNQGLLIYFQEYEEPAYQSIPRPLQEGTPPAPMQLTKRTVYGQLIQFGNYMTETDVLLDINEDGVASLRNGQSRILGEQAAMERARHCILTLEGGTNKYYANGVAAIVNVEDTVDGGTLQKILRSFDITADRLHAEPMTSIVNTNDAFGTVSIMPAYVMVIHPEMRYDIEQLSGFEKISDYPAGVALLPFEIGQVTNRIRVVMDDYMSVLEGAGGAAGTNVKETGGQADVYPFFVLAKSAFKVVPLQGEDGSTLIVKPVGSAGAGDPLNQFGTVGYKNFGTCVPTHNHRYAVGYAAVTDSPS